MPRSERIRCAVAKMVCPISALESLPMRPPATSLDEQPITKTAPLAIGCASSKLVRICSVCFEMFSKSIVSIIKIDSGECVKFTNANIFYGMELWFRKIKNGRECLSTQNLVHLFPTHQKTSQIWVRLLFQLLQQNKKSNQSHHQSSLYHILSL